MIPRRLPQRDLAACSIAVIALPGHAGERVELLGWTVCTKRVRTSKGDCMKFITMEDTTDLFEVVLFPCAYRRYGHLLNTPGPFAVRGKAENDSGRIVIKADRLRLLDTRREQGELPAAAGVTRPTPSSPAPVPRGASPSRTVSG